MKLWSHARPYLPLGPVFALIALVSYGARLEPYALPGESASLIDRFAGLHPFIPVNHTLWGGLVRVVAALPGGALAWRLNALSALLAAGAVWAVYTLVARIPHNRAGEEIRTRSHRITLQTVSGSVAAMLLMWSLPFWTVATRAHHLPFDVLLVLCLALVFQRFWMQRDWRLFFFFCFAYAAAVTEVPLLVLIAPLLLLLSLIAMLQAGRLNWRTCGWAGLALAAGSLLWGIPVVRLYLHPTAEWLSLTTGWEAFQAVAAYTYTQARQQVTGAGWMLVLLLAVLPAGIVLAPKHADRNRSSLWGSVLLHGLLGLLALITYFRLPVSPLEHVGAGRLWAFPFLLIAVWGGYVAGYGCALLHGLRQWSGTTAKRSGLLSKREWVYCGGVMLLLVGGAVHNGQALSDPSARKINVLSRETLDALGDRTWLVTNGLLDAHLRLAAADRVQDVTLLDLSQARAPHYLRYVASLFDQPRYQSLAEISMTALLGAWLNNEPESTEQMALLTWPDYWLAADYVPVPLNMIYVGVAQDHRLNVDQLYADFQAFRTRLGAPAEWASEYAPRLGAWARQHLGKLANDLGVVMEDAGRLDEAIDLYRAARETDPNNLSALLNLVALGQRQEHPEHEAWQAELDSYLDRRAHEPNIWQLSASYGYVRNPAVHFMRGRAWVASGKPRAGMREVRRAGQLVAGSDTITADAWAETALDTETTLRDPVEELKERLAADPANIRLLLTLFQGYLRRNDVEQAAYYLERLQQQLPDQPLRVERAVLAAVGGDQSRAAELFQDATRSEPGNLRAWAGQAMLALEMEQQEVAERALRQLLQRAEDRPEILYMVARIYTQLGQTEDAQRILENILRRQPGYLPANELLLSYDWHFGRREPARRRIEVLLAQNPGHPLANYVLGTMQMSEGAYALAESSFRASTEQAPRTDAYVNLAWLQQRRGAYAQAEADARAALERAPDYSSAWHTLGLVLLRQERHDEAQAALQRALELDPDNYLARFYTGLLYEQQGLRTESRALLESIRAEGHPLLPEMEEELRRVLARLRN